MVSLIDRILLASTEAQPMGPWDDFWYRPIGGQPTTSGERISADSALGLSAVYGCVKVLAEDVASLPWIIYKRTENGRERAIDHPMYPVLHDGMNENQTSFEWREEAMQYLTLRGNSFNEITWGTTPKTRGYATAITPLHPDSITVEVLSDRKTLRYKYQIPGGGERVIAAENMLHLKGMSNNRFVGMSVVSLARESFGWSASLRRFGSSFLGRSARPSGIVEVPAKMNPQSAERLGQSFRAAYAGADNAGAVPVLEEGATFRPISVKPDEAQYLESMNFSVEETCRWFRIAPHKISHLLRATFSNIEHQGIDHVTSTLRPWLVRIEQRENYQFFAGTPFYSEFMAEGLMRGDSVAQADYSTKLVYSGILTRNEVRETINRNRLDGLDEPLTPVNMAAGVAPPSDPNRGNPAPSRGGRADAILGKVVERTLRREQQAVARLAKKHSSDADAWIGAVTEFYAEHESYIEDVLALEEGVARGYCALRVEDLAGSGAGVIETWDCVELASLALGGLLCTST